MCQKTKIRAVKSWDCPLKYIKISKEMDRILANKNKANKNQAKPSCSNTHTHRGPSYLKYLAAVRGAVDVLTGLVHAKRHTVEQDHHDANPLEPRNDRTGVKDECSWAEHTHKHKYKLWNESICIPDSFAATDSFPACMSAQRSRRRAIHQWTRPIFVWVT